MVALLACQPAHGTVDSSGSAPAKPQIAPDVAGPPQVRGAAFEDLMKSGWGAEHARRIYARARSGYRAVTTGTVDQIVREQ